MVTEELWASLPALCKVSFSYKEYTDDPSAYSAWECMVPDRIHTCETEYDWDGLHFTSKKEYFGAPRNPHLLVFRQTIEPFANCEMELESRMNHPDPDSVWTVEEILFHENNSCGFLLRHKDGYKAALTETTQITSVSFHVDEARHEVTRSYHLAAFEECPIRVEKYISLYTDDEEDYIEQAYLECRNASKVRFEDLKGPAAWNPKLSF